MLVVREALPERKQQSGNLISIHMLLRALSFSLTHQHSGRMDVSLFALKLRK